MEQSTLAQLRIFGKGIFGVVTSFSVFNAGEIITVWLRLIAMLLGIIISLATLVSIIRVRKEKALLHEVSYQRAAIALCEQCRLGHTPDVCPIQRIYRPSNCPHKTQSK